MKILYNEKQSTTDTYTYRINQGGKLGVMVSNGSDRHVKITFTNGELESVWFDLDKADIDSKWIVLGAIADKVKSLKEMYHN